MKRLFCLLFLLFLSISCSDNPSAFGDKSPDPPSAAKETTLDARSPELGLGDEKGAGKEATLDTNSSKSGASDAKNAGKGGKRDTSSPESAVARGPGEGASLDEAPSAPPIPGGIVAIGDRAEPSREGGSDELGDKSNGDILDNRLTAGSFDDALNLDIFSKYWSESSLPKLEIKGLEQPQWSELVPNKSQHSVEKLDLAFVIDITGSMADELRYLQAEIDGISQEIASRFPNVQQNYAVVAYRDKGDEFVTRKFEFTDDLGKFQRFLNEQRADGGGDYPEAMHEALKDSLSLQWNGDKSAKIMFLVADAPPHDDKIQQTFEEIFAIKNKGITIYPVAASGVQDLAESIMRTSALLTGGQYIFLTDDSGIGNSHAEPKFPCYFVEKLRDVMLRVISDELSGTRSDPDPKSVMRTVGHPVNGVCGL